MKEISGGVCAPVGFCASGIHCGIRKNKVKKDLALIMSQRRAAVAGVFTQNIVKGASIPVTKKHMSDGYAQAIIVNSGNANTCTTNGETIANDICSLTAQVIGINKNDVLIAQTGVIGVQMSIDPIKNGLKQLYSKVDHNDSLAAAEAIMTTDTVTKSVAVEFVVDGKKCKMGAIAKGVGMVCPNMATNLIFITTDVAISSELLQKSLSNDVKSTFNMVSVDGDQSTNDMCLVLANGMSGNTLIENEGRSFTQFKRALNYCTTKLSKMIAKDGEGATKLIECNVLGAKSTRCARVVARSVIKSSLFKCAMFGADANWGRILCAIGYSGENLDVRKIDVEFVSKNGKIIVCTNGCGVDFSEELAKTILSQDEVSVNIYLNSGKYNATAWGCDLTYDYVKINGDYRT